MSAGIRAFSRSRVLLGPGRSDVDIAMTKWWTKKRPAEGQVRPSALQLLLLKLWKTFFFPFIKKTLTTFPLCQHIKKVTRTISAHEQHPVGPWLRTFPKKVRKTFRVKISHAFWKNVLLTLILIRLLLGYRLLNVHLLTSFGSVDHSVLHMEVSQLQIVWPKPRTILTVRRYRTFWEGKEIIRSSVWLQVTTTSYI